MRHVARAAARRSLGVVEARLGRANVRINAG
jgi:hypothetical protein